MNVPGKSWFDPVRCLQCWMWLGLNIICLTVIIKLGKLLLYVAL